MTQFDIRWQQRFENYQRALAKFKAAVGLAQQRPLTELEQQGLIQGFEFTHELAWKVIKDYLEYQGTQDITGSRDAVREAFSRGMITNGDVWMEMIKSRNKTSHTYNQTIAEEIVAKILSDYIDCFCQLEARMIELKTR